MPTAEDIQACKDLVLGYCEAINDWEKTREILRRVQNDQYVSDAKRRLIENLKLEAHSDAHREIFRRFIIPRERKYGSNPGVPSSWGSDGSFFDVSRKTIQHIEFPTGSRAEVVADWGYQLPGGSTMFVLKKLGGKWLIDSLKLKNLDGIWRPALL